MRKTESWRDEMRAQLLYRALAKSEAGRTPAELFEALADESRKQAEIWRERALEAGEELPPDYRPDARTRLVIWLVRRLGARPLRAVLAAMKVRGLSVYAGARPPGAQLGHSAEAEGRRHRGVQSGGTLRAAVFGVSDGLVSNAGLILGVAGATSEPYVIALSGVAGLLAGALSMAAGEYVSVRSQRELFEHQIELERHELEAFPAEEAAELALIYAARGLPREQAQSVARQIIADPERALDTLAREELGLDPEQLGSPWGAAVSSSLAFATGAAVPLVPFALGAGRLALSLSVAATAAGLFAVGAALSLFTGRGAVASGLRMLGIGAAAGAITFTIGSLFGG